MSGPSLGQSQDPRGAAPEPEPTWPCPRCRTPQPYGAKFCANCGLPLSAAGAPAPAASRQELAKQSVSSAHWGCAIQLFALTGAIVGFFVGVWAIGNTDFSLRILLPFILPLVGAYIGWRLALSMWASSGG